VVGTHIILSVLLLCISFSDYFNNCSLNQQHTAMPNHVENAQCIFLFYFIPQACHTITNKMGWPGDAETRMNTFGVVSSSHSRIAGSAVPFHRHILVTASVLSLLPPLADDLWLKLQTPAECSPLFLLSHHCLPCPPCPRIATMPCHWPMPVSGTIFVHAFQ